MCVWVFFSHSDWQPGYVQEYVKTFRGILEQFTKHLHPD